MRSDGSVEVKFEVVDSAQATIIEQEEQHESARTIYRRGLFGPEVIIEQTSTTIRRVERVTPMVVVRPRPASAQELSFSIGPRRR